MSGTQDLRGSKGLMQFLFSSSATHITCICLTDSTIHPPLLLLSLIVSSWSWYLQYYKLSTATLLVASPGNSSGTSILIYGTSFSFSPWPLQLWGFFCNWCFTVTHLEDLAYYQIRLPAWDAVLAPSGPQFWVLTMRKYFLDCNSKILVSSIFSYAGKLYFVQEEK